MREAAELKDPTELFWAQPLEVEEDNSILFVTNKPCVVVE